MKVMKTVVLTVAAVLMIGVLFAGAVSADDTYGIVNVTDVLGERNYTTLEAAYAHVWADGTIHLRKDVTLSSTFTIDKGLRILGHDHFIKSVADDLTKNNLIKISIRSQYSEITLENLTIDFNGKPGDLIIIDYSATSISRTPVNLNNVKLKGMQTESILNVRSALHIAAANVTVVNLIIDQPAEPTLLDRWVSTIDMQAISGTHWNSNLTIDAMPYGAYCNGDPQAEVYQLVSGVPQKVEPIVIELLLTNLYVWPGFDKPVETVKSWNELAQAVSKAEFGDVITLGASFQSSGTPKKITIPAGVLINPYGKESDHYMIRLNDGYSIVVNDALGLGSLLGYQYAVAFGPGHIVVGKDFLNVPILADNLYIPPGTTIQVDEFGEGPKNTVTVDIPAGKPAILTVDKDGYVKVKENKDLIVKGDGSVKFVNDPREDFTYLTIEGTLTFSVPVQWQNVGVKGTGTLNLLNPDSEMPQGAIPPEIQNKITVVPFASSIDSEKGSIINTETGEEVDITVESCKYLTSWKISDDLLTIGDTTYQIVPKSGYVGSWKHVTENTASNGLLQKVAPGSFTVVFTAANRGHSASIPTDYTPSSSVPVMVQETAKPTTTPTVAAPTVMPTTKPTTQQTQKSPAPFAGLIAGLGIAGLVLSRLRK